MSQIGFVKQEMISVRKDGKEEMVKWLECHFRVAGMRPFSAKLSPNKKKEKETHPDFYMYLRANVNKGEKFRDIRIGALWIKEKHADGEIKKFMTGNVFMDFREIPIVIWKAEPRFDGEAVEYLYDIMTMNDNNERANRHEEKQGYDVVYESADVSQANDAFQSASASAPGYDEEIPF